MIGLIVFIILAAYISIAYACVSRIKSRKGKIAALLVFVLIPTADVIVGRIYFFYLCNTQAGQFVYKTVEVGDEYLYKRVENIKSEVGKKDLNNINSKEPDIDIIKIRDQYEMPVGAQEKVVSRAFHITQWRYYIKNKQTEELLSEFIAFLYKGGWIENIYNMSPGMQCPRRGIFNSNALIQNTFKVKE